MVVTPFVGHDVVVRYDQIERMEWAGFRKASGYRDLTSGSAAPASCG